MHQGFKGEESIDAPNSAALCSGVHPLASGFAGSPPLSMRYLTTGTIAAPPSPTSASVAVKMGVSPAGGEVASVGRPSDVTD
jgi:hypothetical protein